MTRYRVSTRPAARGRRTLLRAGAFVVLVGVGLTLWSSPAAADLVDPPGACAATAAFGSGGFTVDSAVADRDQVIEVPRADQVAWSGRVVGPEAGTERPVAGSVSLALPAPLGSLVIGDWSGTASTVENAGIQDYDVPAVVPAGVVFRLHAEHHESGALYCTATAQLRIAGSPWSSPATWVVLGLTLGLAAALVVVGLTGSPGTGRLVGGGVLGLFTGLLLGLTLVLTGTVPLHSAVPLIAALLGLFAGAAWGRWSPLRRSASAPIVVGADR